tara:strand:- start:188 stop:325 length:138 start_codon:yes stop_codon:yes gene_type:complete
MSSPTEVAGTIAQRLIEYEISTGSIGLYKTFKQFVSLEFLIERGL